MNHGTDNANSTESAAAVPSHSGSDSGQIVWRNGRLVDARTGGVSAFDHGLLTGDGVFETLIARNGVPYAEGRHYRRLVNSATTMGLETPSQQELSDAIAAVLKANDMASEATRIRITLTGGDSPLGSDRGKAEQTALVAVSPSPEFPVAAQVVTVPFARNDQGALVGLKTISYGENVVALKYAKERGAGEAIFGNTRGQLCEGTGTNIFAAFDSALMTPPLSSGCLAGVTRGVVLEVCEREGIAVTEHDVPLSDLENADEAFLTSTLRDVQPIESVNGKSLGAVPGPFAKRLRAAFQAYAVEVSDP